MMACSSPIQKHRKLKIIISSKYLNLNLINSQYWCSLRLCQDWPPLWKEHKASEKNHFWAPKGDMRIQEQAEITYGDVWEGNKNGWWDGIFSLAFCRSNIFIAAIGALLRICNIPFDYEPYSNPNQLLVFCPSEGLWPLLEYWHLQLSFAQGTGSTQLLAGLQHGAHHNYFAQGWPQEFFLLLKQGERRGNKLSACLNRQNAKVRDHLWKTDLWTTVRWSSNCKNRFVSTQSYGRWLPVLGSHCAQRRVFPGLFLSKSNSCYIFE